MCDCSTAPMSDQPYFGANCGCDPDNCFNPMYPGVSALSQRHGSAVVYRDGMGVLASLLKNLIFTFNFNSMACSYVHRESHFVF